MKTRLPAVSAALAAVLMAAGGAPGQVYMETVPVGNTGNTGRVSGEGAGGYGPTRTCGAVNYQFNIGKYEVTAGQYCEFLNKVAGVDTYGLYNASMWSSDYGCKIERYAGNGTSGNPYRYRVGVAWTGRPVNYVSFWDACRFANWLHNGETTGLQSATTTEDGAYTLNGYNGTDGRNIQRNTRWRWAVTSEDEWYKAAYHKNDGDTGNYFRYPTANDSIPSNDLPDRGNNANFWDAGYTIGSPYWRTTVGEFPRSESPYGTLDQGGNVWEWNEAIFQIGTISSSRGLRGGAFDYAYGYMSAPYRRPLNWPYPTDEDDSYGFRVSQVPEPATLALLALSGLALLRRKRGCGG